MRKTKIVCTLGPATEKGDVLRRLFLNGMNVARINFSHGTQEEHGRTVDSFKALRNELGLPVGLLIDTKGPEIRIRDFADGQIELSEGDIFTFTGEDVTGTKEIVSVTYRELAKDVKKGDRILLDDGLIAMEIVEKEGLKIRCRVLNGGTLGNKKGLNVPDVSINLPYMSDRDRSDILFAIGKGFDFIAASFVRNAECVKEIRKLLEDNGGTNIKIIAKIENREGVNNIDDIIRVSDGIMVARGDMGVEIPFEELPPVQKMIIRKSYEAGKPVITATQMLDSMIRNPRPTRAEITDVANAIYDGTSAIMLSGETSVGKYPVEAVQTMSKIAVEAERNIDYIGHFNKYPHEKNVSHNVTNAISHATCSAAHALGARFIISVTKSGHTARMVSKFRPACPIIATTVLSDVYYQLSLSWGVVPVMTETRETTDEIFEHAIETCLARNIIKNGDLVVITGGMPVGISGTTNTLRVHIVGNVLITGKGVNGMRATGNVHVIDELYNGKGNFNAGDIVVLSRTTDDILPSLKYASAIVTEEDMDASKAAIVGRALDIPVITNAADATEILKSGTIVTVDASKGVVLYGSGL